MRRLLPLLAHLDLETAYRPWTPATAEEAALASAMPEGDRVIINGGALACLAKLAASIDPAGFILVNDYGPVRAEDVATHVGVQRFGGSVALGLNFPLLESALAGRGHVTAEPEGDEQRRVHTRLIARISGRAHGKSCAQDSAWSPTGSSMPRRKRRAPTSRPGAATKRSMPTAG